MTEEIKETIKLLATKAGTRGSIESMQYAQAVLSLAQALGTLDVIKNGNVNAILKK